MNGCDHVWICNGHGRPGDAGDCQRPTRFICCACGLIVYRQCGTGRESRCLPCATIKRGDLKAIARSGVTGNPADRIYFGTLTAPGEKPTRHGYRIGWQPFCKRHRADVKCSGDLGCMSDANDLAVWHSGLQKRWSYFRQFMERQLPGCEVQCMGAWEGQRRGALHRHMLFRVVGPATHDQIRAAFGRYRDEHDFGKQSDLQSIDTRDPKAMARKAGYIAKYITKGYDDLRSVPCGFDASSPSKRLRCERRFRPWSASRSWGDTLRDCVMRRLMFALGVNGARTPLAFATGTPAAGGGLDPNQETSTTVDDTAMPSDLPVFAM